VAKMCRIFEVSPSGYYVWLHNPGSTVKRENQAIYETLKASYDLNKGRTGLDKLLADVREIFPKCSRNRLYKIQKAHHLYSIRKRKFKATTNSRHDYPVAPNLLNQNFHVEEPNKVWVTDISYIGTDEGWLYLATVKDLFDRQIVGFATGNFITSELCKRALRSAIRRYNPGNGLIHHSDRGVQYASKDYQRLLQQNHMICSMSRTGVPYDNACAETFFSTIKLEMIYQERFKTRAQVQAAIFEYIEIYYNRRRRNAAIGNIPPCEFRRRYYQKLAA
jgi:putative transposase